MSAIVRISPFFSFFFKEGRMLFCTGDYELALEEGNIYGIFGSNGVGKTTLLNVISTILRPTSGSIRYQFGDKSFEFDATSTPLPVDLIDNNMRRCFQVPMLIDEWTVEENIRMVRRKKEDERIGRVFAKESVRTDAKIDELLGRVGLPAHEMAGNLSYGQRRLLANLQMICSEAPLLILDEPFANLHESVIAVLQAEYKRIVKDRHVTIIVVEHKRKVIEEFADRIILIKNQKVLFEDTDAES